MTTIEFEDAPALDQIPDTEPPSVDPAAPYGYTASGRVRKRPIGARGAKTTGGSTAKNERLATQATAVIMDLNDYAMLGATMTGLTDTAGIINDRADQFRARVYGALLLDPSLAEQITRAGVKSGKLMLLIAIITHLISILPTAVVEVRELREARTE